MNILPSNKPQFSESSFEKVCRYFLGDNWKEIYPVVELAIRNPKIAFYNDELAVWTKALKSIKTFNWNADPSAYIIKGKPKAILKKGVHLYKLSYHHINDPKKRYVALRPATPGEALPVWRRSADGKFTSSIAIAIDQHKGGSDSTWSEGCQTTHFSQYPDFIQTIGDAFGIRVPLGIVSKPDSRLLKGVGKFPYILIEQSDYKYIIDLPESEFDSAADLKYQAQQFVGVPKIEKAVPVFHDVAHVEPNILSKIEQEETFNGLTEDEIDLNIPQNSAAEDGGSSANTTGMTPGDSANSQPPSPSLDSKKVEAPASGGFMKRALAWLAGFGLVPPSVATLVETFRNYSADGQFDLKEALATAGIVAKFIFPYLVYIGIAFIVFWGIKELLKQVSLLLQIWVTAKPNMHDVCVVPHGTMSAAEDCQVQQDEVKA